jgi:uncharacterized protein YjbI with pentapeptide repeats
MADSAHLAILSTGVTAWNAWRTDNPSITPNLSGIQMVRAHLKGINFSRADLTETALDGANLTDADLSQAALNGSTLLRANLYRANLRGAQFSLTKAFSANFRGVLAEGAQFDGALLWQADFTDAKCASAVFRDAGLRATWFQRADLSHADLTFASFVKTHLDDAILDNCLVYGASVWDLQGTPASQRNLVISPAGEPTIAVDDFKVAQFIRLLLTNSEIREVIETIGRKAVLILGRFTPERKEVLDAIREELRKRNYLPLMFDFDRPADRSLIETVVTLGHLSRFVIADITDAKVVLQELQAIVPQLPTLPVMPIVQAGAPMTAAIADFSTNANFIADIFEYLDIGQIRDLLPTAVIAPAEARRAKIESDRAAFEAKYLKKI